MTDDERKEYHARRMRDHRKAVAMGRYSPRIIDSTGTRRRIEALLAIGWELQTVANRLGRSKHRLEEYLRGTHVHVTTAATVRALYDELSMTPGPSKARRTRSAKRGYMPPLAWEDVDIDDPAAVPNTGESLPPDNEPDMELVRRVLVHQARWGQLNRAEKVAFVEACLARGWAAGTISRSYAVNGQLIQRFIDEVQAARTEAAA